MPRYQVKAIVEADKATVNGRVYTREVLESAVNDMKERLKDHTVVGQLGNLERITHVDLRNASHVLKDVAINDKGEVWAEIETLPTENGKIADKIIERRNAAGPFKGPSDLKKVHGIGKKKLENMLQSIIFD